MKNRDARNLLKKTVVVAITGVSILNIAACGKADDAVPVAQTAEVIESTVAEEEFTWEDRDLTDTKVRVDNFTHLYAEPRLTADTQGDLYAGDEFDAVAEAFQNDTALGFCKVDGGYISLSDASYVILDAVHTEEGLQEVADGVETTQTETAPETQVAEKPADKPADKPAEQTPTQQTPSQEAPSQEQPPAQQPPASNPSDAQALADAWGVELLTPTPDGGDHSGAVIHW